MNTVKMQITKKHLAFYQGMRDERIIRGVSKMNLIAR